MAGSIETKAISALKLELKLELAGAELGKKQTGDCRTTNRRLLHNKQDNTAFALQIGKFRTTK